MSMWLVNTSPTFGVAFAPDGDQADAGTVTVTVTRADGTVIVTDDPTTKTGAGATTVYTWKLALANAARLDLLRLDWKRIDTQEILTTREELVGNLLFSEAQARAKTITGQQTPVGSDTDYPDLEIARIRSLITEQFEDRTGRAWTRRYSRVELIGNGSTIIDLWDGEPRDSQGTEVGGPGRFRHVAKIIAATIDGVAATVSDLAIDGRRIIHKTGVWTAGSVSDPHNVIIEYEYGPNPVPLEANENGLRMALANLVSSDVSSYAQTFAGEDGTTTFGPVGLAWPTTVWEWLKHNKPVLVA